MWIKSVSEWNDNNIIGTKLLTGVVDTNTSLVHSASLPARLPASRQRRRNSWGKWSSTRVQPVFQQVWLQLPPRCSSEQTPRTQLPHTDPAHANRLIKKAESVTPEEVVEEDRMLVKLLAIMNKVSQPPQNCGQGQEQLQQQTHSYLLPSDFTTLT